MKVGKAAKGFLKSPMSSTRGETLGMAAVTGVAIGTTNSQINQHYIAKGHAKYKSRRIAGMHGTLRKEVKY